MKVKLLNNNHNINEKEITTEISHKKFIYKPIYGLYMMIIIIIILCCILSYSLYYIINYPLTNNTIQYNNNPIIFSINEQEYIHPLDKIIYKNALNVDEVPNNIISSNNIVTAKIWMVSKISNNDLPQLISGKNIEYEVPIASITKLFTAYYISQMHPEFFNQSFTITKNEAESYGSNSHIPLGSTITGREVIKGLLLASGNDMATLIQDWLLSKGENINTMNQWLISQGFTHTHFSTFSGLDINNEKHYSTSRDISLVISNIYKKSPFIYQIITLSSTEIKTNNNNIILKNTHPLLESHNQILGGKTGFTKRAGYSLVSIKKSTSDNSLYIIITLGSDSKQNRIKDQEKLIDKFTK